MRSRVKVTLLSFTLTALIAAACQKSESLRANAGSSTSTATPAADAHPPFGVLDVPRENVAVEPGSWGYGWALDDSGIASVTVSFDGGPVGPTKIGEAFPGVKEAYPNLPDSDRAGFIFAIPKFPPGQHSLTVTIVAKDGGQTTLGRQFQTK